MCPFVGTSIDVVVVLTTTQNVFSSTPFLRLSIEIFGLKF